MTLDELRSTKRDAIRAVAFARGEAREQSDIDFLIEAVPRCTPFVPGGLLADLEGLIERRVDVVEEKALHKRLRDRILSEAVPL